MKKHIAVLLLLAAGGPGLALSPHPRLWLTPQMVSEMSTHPDWPTVKANADAYLTQPIQKVTITAATNSNPVTFTTAELVPWSGTTALFFGGATAAWAPINTPDTAVSRPATKTGAYTFTVPLDSTSWGTFAGQSVTSFMNGGCLSDYICYSYEGLGWLRALQTLSLAYRVTGAVGYANKAREILSYINTLAPAQITAPVLIDLGYPSRSAALGVALAFDWVYDQLTDAEKAATAGTCNAWYDAYATGRLYATNGQPSNNYWGGHILGFGALGHATYGDNARAQEIIDYVRNEWNGWIPVAFAPLTNGMRSPYGAMSGGYPVESYNYGPNHLTRLLQYMLILKTANNEDLFAGTNYAQLYAKNLLYNLKPNRWQSSTDGDFPGSYTGVMPGTLPIFLSYILAGTTEGAWMQFYFNNFATPPSSGALSEQRPADIDRLLWYRPGRTSVDYRPSQPPYYFSGEGRAYWRSGWSDSSSELWSMFDAGGMYYAAHQGKTAGHIDIQRGGDYLIVNSQQWRGLDGVQGSPALFSTTSQWTSTLFFDDGGAYMYAGGLYVGGQGEWWAWKEPRKNLNPNYAYASTDLTEVYDREWEWGRRTGTRSLTYFYRTFVAIGDGTFVVFDRVRASSSAYTKHLRFHMSGANGAPALSGNVVKQTVGASSISIKTLLPAAPAINIVQNSGATSYRAEISDSIPGTDLNALNVLYATASSGGLPQTTLLTTIDPNFYGVQVADATPKVVVLAQTAGSAVYGSTSFTTSFSGTGKILVADLTAGPYDVRKDGAAILTAQSVDANGTLYFTSSSGAFSILPNTGAPPTSACDLNSDGTVNTTDVQLAKNQALGVTGCTTADLDANGLCNVIDTQRVTNAALGQPCKVGP